MNIVGMKWKRFFFESEYIAEEKQQKKIQKREITDLVSDMARTVYEVFGEAPLSVNEVTDKLNLPVNTVLGALTELEIYGYIQIYDNIKYRLSP